MKLLVLATDPVDAEDLRGALEGEEIEGAEVLVVSPAVNESAVAFWVSDSDEAIRDAESAAEQTAAALRAEGARARSTAGESDPLLALQDALTTFDADEIVLFTHPGSDANWQEEGVVKQAEERFDKPVRHMVVEG
jgi:hypothetical protein